MRYFNIVLSASLMILLYILSVAPTLAAADVFAPYRISLGPDGNIYALVSGNESTASHIFVFAPDGRLVKTLDKQAWDLAFDDAGNLYALSTAYRPGQTALFNITRLDNNGNATLLWSNVNQSYLDVADMAVGPGGVVYFSTIHVDLNHSAQSGDSDSCRCEIDAIDANGRLRVVYPTNTTLPSGGFGMLAVDRNGALYTAGISDWIAVISPDGSTKTIGKQGSENGTFNWIGDIAIGPDGYLYVADLKNRRVQKLTTDGTFVSKWGGCGPDQFMSRCCLAIDKNSRVYVADTENQRIVWFTPNYTFGTVTNENLKGQSVTWGNVYAGANYTTQFGSEATPEPGFAAFAALIGIGLGAALYCRRK